MVPRGMERHVQTLGGKLVELQCKQAQARQSKTAGRKGLEEEWQLGSTPRIIRNKRINEIHQSIKAFSTWSAFKIKNKLPGGGGTRAFNPSPRKAEAGRTL